MFKRARRDASVHSSAYIPPECESRNRKQHNQGVLQLDIEAVSAHTHRYSSGVQIDHSPVQSFGGVSVGPLAVDPPARTPSRGFTVPLYECST